MTTKNVFVLAVPTLVNYTTFSGTFNTKSFKNEEEFEAIWNKFIASTGASTEDMSADEYDEAYDASNMTHEDFHYMRLHHFIERLNNGGSDPFDSESDVEEYFYAYVTIGD